MKVMQISIDKPVQKLTSLSVYFSTTVKNYILFDNR